jgi:YceG-like family
MSDEHDDVPPVPPVGDPFLADDPEAHEREQRRLQREARRRERSGRKSLASRVGGALDGTARKSGRPAADSDPAEDGRMSAEDLMPRRPARRPEPPLADPAPAPESELAPVGPVTEDHDWFADADADGGPPPEVPPERRAVATGDYPPLPPPSQPPPGSTRDVWIRRLIALGVILLAAIAAYAVVGKLGDDDPAPVPTGPKTLKTEDVTIPEGYTRSQIAGVARKAGLKGDYEKATAKAPKGFDLKKTGAPSDASLEGFLFPATYNLEQGARVDTLVKNQLSAFDENFAKVDMSRAKKKNLTEYDVVTIASMIEREVLVPKERRLVAAVIYNRLAQGIPLGIDATLRYKLDNFDKPLTESELQTDSPYNTRLVQGLPPSPISNPGLDSLQAAADPAKVDYTYYVVKPGTCGKHYFTDDYDDFLAASEKYNSAREAQGGSPTDC